MWDMMNNESHKDCGGNEPAVLDRPRKGVKKVAGNVQEFELG